MFLSSLVVLVGGCTSAEAREERAVIAAIGNLRDSSADDLVKRRELIAALSKVPVTTPLARKARDACAETYQLMLEGREGMEKIKADMARLGTAPKNAVEDLAAAKEKVDKSETSMKACQEAAAELAMKRH
ncbi:MAG TPA: hypothetical protein PK156_43255 [Polyangium sp.]|nr:hypothetical protein [Polyangium sp.]